MRAMSNVLIAVLLALVFWTGANAGVPGLMNYQGLLTDAGGDPVVDGTYEVTFRIYDQGSTERWSEVHNVTTVDGLFSVQLGSNGSPLNPGHFEYTECWLGIQITGESEMTPRVQLTSVPYATTDGDWEISEEGVYTGSLGSGNVGIGTLPAPSIKLRVSAGETWDPAVGTGVLVEVHGEDAGTSAYGIRASASKGSAHSNTAIRGSAYGSGADENVGVLGTAYAGTANWAGRFESNVGVFRRIGDDSLVILDSTTYGGGAITTWGPGQSRNVQISHVVENHEYGSIVVMDHSSQKRAQMCVDGEDDYGCFATFGPNGYLNVLAAGSDVNHNHGMVTVHGEGDGALCGIMAAAADEPEPSTIGRIWGNRLHISNPWDPEGSVWLPESSVDAYEMLNEPGIAYEMETGTISITSETVMTDLATVDITIPEDGYIFVSGNCHISLYGTTSNNRAYVQIDETSGGGLGSYMIAVGDYAYSGSSGNHRCVSVDRVYFKSAGSYTFRMEAMLESGSSGDANAYRPRIIATYYPTSYGTVKAFVSGAETMGFSNRTPVEIDFSDVAPNDKQSSFAVDLRELELRAKNARLQAVQAERDLLAAQIRVISKTETAME